MVFVELQNVMMMVVVFFFFLINYKFTTRIDGSKGKIENGWLIGFRNFGFIGFCSNATTIL